MENNILGLHHITAIAGDAKKNLAFYTKILGLRFIKKTVNFDAPGVYHFYYGDQIGNAGTVLTFFPFGENASQGVKGAGTATEIGYSVPAGSLEFWMERFEQHNVIYNKPAYKFGERYLTFLDPDGLKFELTESKTKDDRMGWPSEEITQANATKGFHNITLTLHDHKPTAEVLTGIFGYELVEQEVNRYRYATKAVDGAAIVDIVELPSEQRGYIAKGSVHHVAFRVKDDETLLHFREKIQDAGLSITPRIDRQYFHSLYFKEPGGVLFEIATENPGLTFDETLEDLGKSLKLPPQYEPDRVQIEQNLLESNGII